MSASKTAFNAQEKSTEKKSALEEINTKRGGNGKVAGNAEWESQKRQLVT